jgi:hypothetical protein
MEYIPLEKLMVSQLVKKFHAFYGTRRFCYFRSCCLPSAYCLAYPSTPNMDAVRSSETSVNFCWPTWRYVPEDSSLYGRRCKDLKFKGFFLPFVQSASMIR